MLLPSVLPCENAFRVSRSTRTTTRSQSHRNSYLNPVCATSSTSQHDQNLSMAIGLGLCFATNNPRSHGLANSSEALHQILSLDQNTPPPLVTKPRYATSSAAARVLATPTPSRTPSPQTPANKMIPQHTPWTTPSCDDSSSSSSSMDVDESTPRANTNYTYTYTIVTRNNKRKRTADANNSSIPPSSSSSIPPQLPSLDPFTTPDTTATPIACPPAPKPEQTSSFLHPETDSDDDLLDDPFVTPKRTRLRGPQSKRICSTRRNLGPWSEDEDKQLVGMVLAKMKLSEKDWAECANTLGRDWFSVGERWKGLVEAGSVGLINDKRKEEKKMRARLQGNGRGRLEPVRRGKGRSGLRGSTKSKR